METNKNTTAKNKRDRRHWYDHEKLDIIKRYDAGELLAIPGNPTHVNDPKSKKELSIFSIERWRAQFKQLGILKGKEARPSYDTVPQRRQVKNAQDIALGDIMKDEENVQGLLIKVLMENQRLRRALKESQNAKMGNRERTIEREQEL